MRLIPLLALVLVGCSGSVSEATDDDAGASGDSSADDVALVDDSGISPFDDGTMLPSDGAVAMDAAVPPKPCRTRITYGSAWIHGSDHPNSFDDVDGVVTWDGVCKDDGSNSYATLSNGWKPYFSGRGACVIAFDSSGACSPAPKSGCTTRVTYGSAWLHGPEHPAQYDDVAGPVSWGGACNNVGTTQSSATLSNGWVPHFSGNGACSLSFRYEQCGGLFANPVVGSDCPDPGVVKDGSRYIMSCTGFPLLTSPDLVHWKNVGSIFAAGKWPKWATRDFWAPEIHKVGTRWIAYFSARNGADNRLALGAAIATDPLGPYTDIGRPLLVDPNPGVIDVHQFTAPDGKHYLIWKVDGNAVGAKTPIRIQPLADDGITLTGTRRDILTNDLAWENHVIEGPWMVEHGGRYYLFYSANAYDSSRYAVGVARASSPLGPFTKLGAPILTTNFRWAGPGHGSIVKSPRGDDVHVYHSWTAGQVGGGPGRTVLVDRITWGSDGWPRMFSAPSIRSQAMP